MGRWVSSRPMQLGPTRRMLIGAGDAQALGFQSGAFRPGFAEAARADDGRLQAPPAAVLQGLWHGRGRDQQDRQVDRVGGIQDGGDHRPAQQTAALGVDKMHAPLVVALHQVASQAVTQLGRVL